MHMKQEAKERKGRRTAWKTRAKAVVKKHYLLLVVLCMVAVFFGTEFSYVTSHTHSMYNFLTGQDPDGTGIMVRIDDESILDKLSEHVFSDRVKEIHQEGKEVADQLQEMKDDRIAQIRGGTRGALSSVSSYFSSGKLVETVADTSISIFHSKTPGTVLMILGSFLLTTAVWVFIRNVYRAVLRRMFLEARIYDGVPIARLLHFKVVRRWLRASLTMLLETVYTVLWSLTIVGGVIKTYSYWLVPYIVAENPDIAPKEAVTLSRRMMNGHKVEAFLLDLSFIGWHLLGIVTFGIAEAVWATPYITATQAEFYVQIRSEAKEKGLEGTDALNDSYLYEKADAALLEDHYPDIDAEKAYIAAHQISLTPARAFFAKNFGLWTGSMKEKNAYDDVEGRRQQIVIDQAELEGRLYPVRLCPLWKDEYKRTLRSTRALRTYTIWSVILIFFLFSFVGWAWEVSIHIVKDGVFVNRGVMHGPWLPVYGSGVAMIVVMLARWRPKPALEAVLTILLCGFVEYMTSFYLEMTRGMRWWDYTGYFLNLNGRICGEGLAVFAVGGMLAVYLLVPVFDAMISKLNVKKLAVLCIVLLACFGSDLVYSGKVPNTGEGITDYTDYKDTSDLTQKIEVEQMFVS